MAKELLGEALSALQGIGGDAAQWLQPGSHGGTRCHYSGVEIGHKLEKVCQDLSSGQLLSVVEVCQLVEDIKQITEAMVLGEHNDGVFFDLFCERQALACFVNALLEPLTSQAVRVQLLQSLSILVQNARRERSFYCLLSGGHINALLAGEPDLRDEEVLAYFVTLLKSLALRIDSETSLLFLERSSRTIGTEAFPLFTQAVRLATHTERMVSTAARTALLRLLTIDEPEVRRRAVVIACSSLLPNLTRALIAAWTCASASMYRKDAEVLRSSLDAEEDILGLFHELLLLGEPAVTEGVIRSILVGALLPLLSGLAPPVRYPQHNREDKDMVQKRDAIVRQQAYVATPCRANRNNIDKSRKKRPWNVGCNDINDFGQWLNKADGCAVSSSLKATHSIDTGVGIADAAVLARTVASRVLGFDDQPFQECIVSDRVFGHEHGQKDCARTVRPRELPPSVEDRFPPCAAIVLRAVAVSTAVFARYDEIVEPLAHALLLPSLPSALVAAIYDPGPDGSTLAAIVKREGAAAGSCSSVLVPNPFRGSMMELLNGGRLGHVPHEAPIAAWALRELRANSPSIHTSLPPPERLVGVLRARAQLPRVSQREIAAAIVGIVSARLERTTQRHATGFVVAAMREAGELLRSVARENDGSDVRRLSTHGSELIGEVIEEWNWHQCYRPPSDAVVMCGNAERLLELSRGSAEVVVSDNVGLGGHAVRSLLTLRQLCNDLGKVGPRSIPSVQDPQRCESCPLDAGVKACAGGIDVSNVEAIKCVGPSGRPCGFALHPGLLCLTDWPTSAASGRAETDNGVMVRVPLWQATTVGNSKHSKQLCFHMFVLSSDNVDSGCQLRLPIDQYARRLELHFEDERSCACALWHFERYRERQISQLLAQLVTFVHTVIREAEAEPPNSSLLSVSCVTAL